MAWPSNWKAFPVKAIFLCYYQFNYTMQPKCSGIFKAAYLAAFLIEVIAVFLRDFILLWVLTN
jgi:hypothetical protein